TVTRGKLEFVDACTNGGSDLPLTISGPFGGDTSDEGLTELTPIPFPFTIFNDAPASNIQVSSNGWMVFSEFATDAPTGDNGQMPAFDVVQSAFAPYWDDLRHVTLCQRSDANSYTVQWTGQVTQSLTRRVQMQLRLHKDGSADFI